MCLSTVSKSPYKYKKGCITYNLSIPDKVYTGYKVFLKNENMLSYVITPFEHAIIQLNRWKRDSETQQLLAYDPYNLINKFEAYDTGFHIFLLKKDAKKYLYTSRHSIKKVKFRNVVALGLQGGLLTVVAKEIYVEK
jgi:hypothetical protein